MVKFGEAQKDRQSGAMPRVRLSPQEKIAKLKEQQAQITAQIRQESAKLTGQKRKDDTRRKIIAGALALEHAEIDADFGQALMRLLDRHVTKTADRALFGLHEADNNHSY